MARTYDFSTALYAMKHGEHISREGWNGKGMFLFLQKDTRTRYPMRTRARIGRYEDMGGPMVVDYSTFTLAPFIAMHTTTGAVVPWVASQTDLLADDWVVQPGF